MSSEFSKVALEATPNKARSKPLSDEESAEESDVCRDKRSREAQDSSYPHTYPNLLVLEESLRVQYLDLRDRRRQNIFFLLLLALWNLGFTYLLFFKPREDGRGMGGSVYWVIETSEKMALMGGIVTCILIWGTGQWDRGVRWPRKWLSVTNRGLKVFNAKIVVIKESWWSELLGHITFLFPVGALLSKTRLCKSSTLNSDENLAEWYPGGDHIKLLLLPRPFSPGFRENWDLYRSAYWDQENLRRAQTRALSQASMTKSARLQSSGPWLWRWRAKQKLVRDASSTGGNLSKGHSEKAKRGQHGHISRTSAASDSSGTTRSRRASLRGTGERKRRPKLERLGEKPLPTASSIVSD